MDQEEEPPRADTPESQLATVPAEQFKTWLTPRAAVAQMMQADIGTANNLIMQHLSAGLIRSAARKATLEDDVPFSGTTAVDYFEIPPWYWAGRTSEEYLWTAGFIAFTVGGTWSSRAVTCTGIKFDRDDIEAIATQLPQREPLRSPPDLALHAIQTSTPEVRQGGRPRKPFWDELWADIAAQLFIGDLKAEKQADIERAMLDWAAQHGHEMSEQTARQRARTLMAAIKRRDKN